jgi:hypothetical protein
MFDWLRSSVRRPALTLPDGNARNLNESLDNFFSFGQLGLPMLCNARKLSYSLLPRTSQYVTPSVRGFSAKAMRSSTNPITNCPLKQPPCVHYQYMKERVMIIYHAR